MVGVALTKGNLPTCREVLLLRTANFRLLRGMTGTQVKNLSCKFGTSLSLDNPLCETGPHWVLVCNLREAFDAYSVKNLGID